MNTFFYVIFTGVVLSQKDPILAVGCDIKMHASTTDYSHDDLFIDPDCSDNCDVYISASQDVVGMRMDNVIEGGGVFLDIVNLADCSNEDIYLKSPDLDAHELLLISTGL